MARFIQSEGLMRQGKAIAAGLVQKFDPGPRVVRSIHLNRKFARISDRVFAIVGIFAATSLVGGCGEGAQNVRPPESNNATGSAGSWAPPNPGTEYHPVDGPTLRTFFAGSKIEFQDEKRMPTLAFGPEYYSKLDKVYVPIDNGVLHLKFDISGNRICQFEIRSSPHQCYWIYAKSGEYYAIPARPEGVVWKVRRTSHNISEYLK